jgi:hypothetical protein
MENNRTKKIVVTLAIAAGATLVVNNIPAPAGFAQAQPKSESVGHVLFVNRTPGSFLDGIGRGLEQMVDGLDAHLGSQN